MGDGVRVSSDVNDLSSAAIVAAEVRRTDCTSKDASLLRKLLVVEDDAVLARLSQEWREEDSSAGERERAGGSGGGGGVSAPSPRKASTGSVRRGDDADLRRAPDREVSDLCEECRSLCDIECSDFECLFGRGDRGVWATGVSDRR